MAKPTKQDSFMDDITAWNKRDWRLVWAYTWGGLAIMVLSLGLTLATGYVEFTVPSMLLWLVTMLRADNLVAQINHREQLRVQLIISQQVSLLTEVVMNLTPPLGGKGKHAAASAKR